MYGSVRNSARHWLTLPYRRRDTRQIIDNSRVSMTFMNDSFAISWQLNTQSGHFVISWERLWRNPSECSVCRCAQNSRQRASLRKTFPLPLVYHTATFFSWNTTSSVEILTFRESVACTKRKSARLVAAEVVLAEKNRVYGSAVSRRRPFYVSWEGRWRHTPSEISFAWCSELRRIVCIRENLNLQNYFSNLITASSIDNLFKQFVYHIYKIKHSWNLDENCSKFYNICCFLCVIFSPDDEKSPCIQRLVVTMSNWQFRVSWGRQWRNTTEWIVCDSDDARMHVFS